MKYSQYSTLNSTTQSCQKKKFKIVNIVIFNLAWWNSYDYSIPSISEGMVGC